MYKIFNLVFFILSSVIFFEGCKKDEDQVVFDSNNTKAPTVSANKNSLILLSTSNPDTAIVFSIGKADYSLSTEVNYVLEFDLKNKNFSTSRSVSLGVTTSKSFTVKELNSLLTSIPGVLAGSNNVFEARVTSSIGKPASQKISSNTLILNITPYFQLINYTNMYVPGNYQNWTPATAEKIASVDYSDTYFEGYINFPNQNTEFKFTPKPNWDDDYGDESDTGTSGKLKKKGTNLKVSDAGYYFIKADISSNTWSAEKTNWSIIGDAAKGWDNDIDMTYDVNSKTWSITTDLNGSKNLKFRANKDWKLNYGDGISGSGPDGFLDQTGDNIPILETGNYTITLDLSNPGNYSYKLKKN